MSSDNATPAALGYRTAAEWEPHAATWLSWPHNRETWPERFEPIPAVWAELARTLADTETVHVLCGGDPVMAEARRWLGEVPGVILHDVPTNDAWIRDHGPTFLAGPPGAPPALIDWEYNAWGGKYPPYDLDNAVPAHIAAITGRHRFTVPLVFEGGAVDSDGEGTLLAAERCLLSESRNPGRPRAEIEAALRDYVGVEKVLWLGGELAGDDTDGHVDQLARFVGPARVVAAVEEDPQDVNYEPLRENLARLAAMTDARGRALAVISLPMPAAKFCDGHRLPASYANFYIANGVVVVPQFGDAADAVALDILARLFPGRRTVGQNALDLVWGLGAFHCITQQEPVPGSP